MKSLISLAVLFPCALIALHGCKDEEKKAKPLAGREYTGALFGKPYYIDVVGDSTDYAFQIDSILRIFERTFSLTDTSSVVSRFNRFDETDKTMIFNDSTKVFGIVFDIIRDLNKQSNQIIDPSTAPLKREWFKIKFAGLTGEPNLDSLYEFVSFDGVKIDLIEIDHPDGSYAHSMLRKKDKRSELDMTEIAAAYACDMLSDFFISKGVRQHRIKYDRGVLCRGIDVSDLNVITLGMSSDSTDQKIQLVNGAYAYCGMNEKAGLVDITYGYPAENELLFVGVSAKMMTTAVAFADAFMVMGFEQCSKWYEDNEDSGVQSFMLMRRDKEITSASTVGFDEMILVPEGEQQVNE